jgi:hypothetical protein
MKSRKSEQEKNISPDLLSLDILCDQIIDFGLREYAYIANFAKLGRDVIDEIPIELVEDIKDDITSGLSIRIGLNRQKEVVKVFIHKLLISKKIIMEELSSRGYEYVKVLVISMIAHELYHVYEILNKIRIDKIGTEDNESEKEARLFSIIVLQEYLNERDELGLDINAIKQVQYETMSEVIDLIEENSFK